MRRLVIALLLAGCLPATTLEKLSLDDMILKSTAILRGRITGSYAAQHGPVIYTHFTVAVVERWKGPAASQADVIVPGGTVRGLRQSFAGAPNLEPGSDYVLFLWTSKSGLTHIIGLSQGVFDLRMNSKGEPFATRGASSEAVLNPTTGQAVKDDAVQISLGELRERINRVLGGARQ